MSISMAAKSSLLALIAGRQAEPADIFLSMDHQLALGLSAARKQEEKSESNPC
jgi:hypothetical protein